MTGFNGLNEVLEAVKTCKKCGLYKYRDKCVFAQGRDDAKTMLIGLSPGREENLSGKLFVGPAGDFLNKLLRLAGLDREALYITNIIKCHAPTYAIGQKEVSACSEYMDKQIEIIKSKTIIPLGSVATQYILEKYNLLKKRISEIHGQIFYAGDGDLFNSDRRVKIIPMFHPAAALRTPGLSALLEKDWQRLYNEL